MPLLSAAKRIFHTRPLVVFRGHVSRALASPPGNVHSEGETDAQEDRVHSNHAASTSSTEEDIEGLLQHAFGARADPKTKIVDPGL